jgi:hypothetical protein
MSVRFVRFSFNSMNIYKSRSLESVGDTSSISTQTRKVLCIEMYVLLREYFERNSPHLSKCFWTRMILRQ